MYLHHRISAGLPGLAVEQNNRARKIHPVAHLINLQA